MIICHPAIFILDQYLQFANTTDLKRFEFWLLKSYCVRLTETSRYRGCGRPF